MTTLYYHTEQDLREHAARYAAEVGRTDPAWVEDLYHTAKNCGMLGGCWIVRWPG